jgi:NAD(P)H-hydrate epimerase
MILVTAGEMQAIDRRTIESFGLPGRVLMENAGRGASRILLEQFSGVKDRPVGVMAGRGNNGGDGFVIARCLHQQGIRVVVYLLANRQRVKGDAADNLELLQPLGVPVVEIPDENTFNRHKQAMSAIDIWVDAILGTGLKSTVKGYFQTVIDFINSQHRPVLAVDIASGLDSDTGQICGTCIRAAATATFGFAKTGQMLQPGVHWTGHLEVIDIGIPPHIVKSVNPRQYLVTPRRVRSCLPPRPEDAHKGTTGHLLVVAGSRGKTGAASMTVSAALRAGAGLVTLASGAGTNTVAAARTMEVMTTLLPEDEQGAIAESAFDLVIEQMNGKKCLALGPGLGQAAGTQRLVRRIIVHSPIALVVDADGINALAGHTHILKKASAPIILTPHPGEMARLLDTRTMMVQQDRIGCARDFATEFKVHLVLKGARTVIAHPDGRVFVNPTGNAGMASAGMGDVLTGLIAGLATQGTNPGCAALAGVYLHGGAADSLAAAMGPYGYLAGEVLRAVPGEIKKIGHHHP